MAPFVFSLLSEWESMKSRCPGKRLCAWGAGGPFVRGLADALHPQHGTIVVNMHCGPRPRLGENLLRQLRGLPPLTFDEGSPEATEVIRYARVLKCALLTHL